MLARKRRLEFAGQHFEVGKLAWGCAGAKPSPGYFTGSGRRMMLLIDLDINNNAPLGSSTDLNP